MKKFKIIFIIGILLIPSLAFASKGYDLGGTVSWSTTTGTRKCPSGKVLLDEFKNKNTARSVNSYLRSGASYCYIPDNTGPTISINSNGYQSGKWTKADQVVLNISTTDSGSEVGSVKYKINGITTNASSNFNLTFEKEGIYTVTVIAKDKATVYLYDGKTVDAPNVSYKTMDVKIDKTAPIFILKPTNNGEWTNKKSGFNFQIKDTYEGEARVSKEFSCGELPINSKWTDNRVVNGSITGNCKKIGENVCVNDSEFEPNSGECGYNCNDGYIEGNDGNCYLETIMETCDSNILPTNTYDYDKSDNLVEGGSSEGYVAWRYPNGVNQEGQFISVFDKTNNSYSPSTSSCGFECSNGYHAESNKCVNDSKIVCCNEPYLSTNTTGASIDCTLDENKDDVQCVLSPICDYQKELMGMWDLENSRWDYTTTSDGTKEGEEGKQEHCGYTLLENSNGATCNPYYYLILVNGKPVMCNELSSGYYSGQENEYYTCTNKPNNSYYTSAGTNNDCQWVCNSGYIQDENQCIVDEGSTTTGTSCGVNKCHYEYAFLYFNDNICDDSNGRIVGETTSQKFDTLEECISEQENESKIGDCKKSKHYKNPQEYYAKTITFTCEESFNN